MTADDLILSGDELAALTGYQRPAEQLAELRRQGFDRARRDRLGRVILERAHYLAVCGGACEPRTPALRAPVLRRAA